MSEDLGSTFLSFTFLTLILGTFSDIEDKMLEESGSPLVNDISTASSAYGVVKTSDESNDAFESDGER